MEKDELAPSSQIQAFERNIEELTTQNTNLKIEVDTLQSDLKSKEEELVNIKDLLLNFKKEEDSRKKILEEELESVKQQVCVFFLIVVESYCNL